MPKKNLMWPCINITPQVVIYVTKNQQRYMMAAAKEIRSYTLNGVGTNITNITKWERKEVGDGA